jgi:ATP-binding cassette, subfamily C, bacterial CydC
LTPLAGIVLVAVSTYLISRTALRPNLLDLTAVIVSVRALSIGKGLSRYVERLAGHDVALRVVVDLRHQAYQRCCRRPRSGWRGGAAATCWPGSSPTSSGSSSPWSAGCSRCSAGRSRAWSWSLIGAVLLPAAGPILLVGLRLPGSGCPWSRWRLARRPEQRLAPPGAR